MNKFRFKFETILKIRKINEKNKIYELSKLYFEKNKLEEELNNLESEFRKISRRFKKLVKRKKLNLQYFDFYSKYIGSYINKKRNIEKRLSSLQKEIQLKLQELKKAMKERKIIEKLKEREITKFKEFIKKKEEKAIDEIVTIRFKF